MQLEVLLRGLYRKTHKKLTAVINLNLYESEQSAVSLLCNLNLRRTIVLNVFTMTIILSSACIILFEREYHQISCFDEFQVHLLNTTVPNKLCNVK